jgi:hypothetical protein
MSTIAIFSNNFFTDTMIDQCQIQVPYEIFHSIQHYIDSDAKIKIAFVNSLNSYEMPQTEEQRIAEVTDGKKFCQEIAIVKSVSVAVFVFDNEFHHYHNQILQQHQDPHIHWVLPIYPNHNLQNYKILSYNTQWDWTVNPYKQHLAAKLQCINTDTVKPYFFDALLGWPGDFCHLKLNKIFVDQAVSQSDQKHLFFLKILRTTGMEAYDQLVREPEVQVRSRINTTSNIVDYLGCELPFSRIVPVTIYNQCAYSVVAETSVDNNYSFFTEKIIKPILARRLFVVFSGMNFLQNLKKLGYRTFDTVIDESYDAIEDNQQRWTAAFAQCEKLCTMDQLWVQSQIKQIVDHNFETAVNTQWHADFVDSIKQCVTKLVHEL